MDIKGITVTYISLCIELNSGWNIFALATSQGGLDMLERDSAIHLGIVAEYFLIRKINSIYTREHVPKLEL